MSTQIVPLSAEQYQRETEMSFLTEDFKNISKEEADNMFGQEVELLSFFPTILKYGETREDPLIYSRSEEIVVKDFKYVKYRISNKLSSFDMAFKIIHNVIRDLPNVSRNRILTPIFPAYFKKLLGYEMHMPRGQLHKVPKETLYALMYGAPDLTPYLHQSDLDILIEHDIKTVHTMPVIVQENMVIERFILTTPVKRIVVGGYREFA